MGSDSLERRLAVILAADVAGYSRLVAADEERAIRALRERRRLLDGAIVAHGGRIANTAGDSVIAEFASAVAAVEAARAAQRAIAPLNANLPVGERMAFRIGINLGEVIAQGDDLLGDGVNVAARIQQESRPGGVLVSAKVQVEILGRLDASPLPIGGRRMKNLPAPVLLFEVPTGVEDGPPTAPVRRRMIMAAAAAAAIAAAAWIALQPPTPPLVETSAGGTGRPVIAVLPFANLGGDPAQAYVADGVSDEVIAALGRFSSLSVIARQATRALKDRALTPAEIARTLGARYVVEGGVRHDGRRIRASARLIEAPDARVLWAAQFDEPIEDLFAIQDRIARDVAGALAVGVARVEQRRALARPPASLAAYDWVLRARAALDRLERGANREARQFFARALELDPPYAAAHAGMARALHQMAALGWTEFAGDALARAEAHALQAIAADPASVEALSALSGIQTRTGRFEAARESARRALDLNPSDVEAWHHLGEAMTWSGAFRDAVPLFETALRLDPIGRPEFWFAFAMAQYQLRRHDAAIRAAERGLQHWPQFFSLRVALAASLAQAGRQEEAQAQARILRQAMPGFDARSFGTRFSDPAHAAYALAGLERAGLR